MKEEAKDKLGPMEMNPTPTNSPMTVAYPQAPATHPTAIVNSYPITASEQVTFHHMPVPNPPPEFHGDQKRYKCCCRSCHSTTGCIIIGVIEMLTAVGILIFQLCISYTHQYTYSKTGSIIPVVITCLIVGLMLFGVKKSKPYLLIVHMVWQILIVIGLISVFVFAVVDLTKTNWHSDMFDAYVCIGWLACSCLAILLEIWFFLVILSCYRYLKDKNIFYLLAVHPTVTAYPTVTPYPTLTSYSTDMPYSTEATFGIPEQQNLGQEAVGHHAMGQEHGGHTGLT